MTAMTMLVIKDADAPYGSREVYSYHASLEDAIVFALATVEAHGWTLYKHQRDQMTIAEAERAQAYMAEQGHDIPRSVSAMVFVPDAEGWADSDQHVGAIYASELSTKVVVTRAAAR